MPGRILQSLPNLLSASRLLLMPTALLCAMAGTRLWFVMLTATALLTDAIDGPIARRLQAESALGRKLDSIADYVTLLCGVAGIALLWPAIMRRELPWVASGLAVFFVDLGYGFIRLGHAPCYHTWMAKVSAVVCALSLVPLLAEWTEAPFHFAIILLILSGLEELVIVSLVPWHEGHVRTCWHALQLQRARKAST